MLQSVIDTFQKVILYSDLVFSSKFSVASVLFFSLYSLTVYVVIHYFTSLSCHRDQANYKLCMI